MGQEDKHTKSKHPPYWWGVISLLALVILYSLYSGVALKKIEVPDLFIAEFASTGDAHDNHALTPGVSSPAASVAPAATVPMTPTPIAAAANPAVVLASTAPSRTVTNVEPHIPHDEPAPAYAPESAAASINISGVWFSNDGLQYTISQQGDAVSLQELNPLLGGMVTAEGEGEIDGRQIDLELSTLLGIAGYAELEVSADGQRIQGSYTAEGSFQSMPLQLFRQN